MGIGFGASMDSEQLRKEVDEPKKRFINWHSVADDDYPERSGFKIVTLEYVGGERCIVHRMYDAEKRGFYDGGIHYPNVIAWAEMPEPYRG